MPLIDIAFGLLILAMLGIGGYFLYRYFVNRPPANPCDNGGILKGGVCQCPLGYSGEHCENKDVLCGGKTCYNGGTCVNGNCQCAPGYSGPQCETTAPKCTDKNCYMGNWMTGPMCIKDTCSCNEGWATSGKVPYMCDECAPGYWPNPGEAPAGTYPCSKKLFTTPIKSSVNNCWLYTGWNGNDADGWCKTIYGANSSVYPNKTNPDQTCGGGGHCVSGYAYAMCNVPAYYADPSFNPATWQSCPQQTGGDTSYNNFFNGGMLKYPQ